MQAGRQDFEAESVGDAQGLDFVAGHRGYGNGNVLQALVALLRGNHDFLKCALRLRSACRCEDGERKSGHGGAGKRTFEIHKLSPELETMKTAYYT